MTWAFGALALGFSIRASYCELRKSYVHGCLACWVRRFMLAGLFAMLFSFR